MAVCPRCGLRNPETALTCSGCGSALARPARPEDDRVLRMLVPVGRSGWAIAAGYAALFSVLLVPAPLALLFGILAVRDIKSNPEKIGMGRAIFGIVMGVLFTVGLILFVVWQLMTMPYQAE
jgi:ribosomal protein L40E